MKRAFVAASLACLVGSVLSACGSGTVVASSSAASEDVGRFLAEHSASLSVACEKRAAAYGKDTPPPTTPGSLDVNGFVPVIGPDCGIGYVRASVYSPAGPPPLASEAGGEPLGAVRLEPSDAAPLVGITVPGVPGWVSFEDLAKNDLTVDDVLTMSSTGR